MHICKTYCVYICTHTCNAHTNAYTHTDTHLWQTPARKEWWVRAPNPCPESIYLDPRLAPAEPPYSLAPSPPACWHKLQTVSRCKARRRGCPRSFQSLRSSRLSGRSWPRGASYSTSNTSRSFLQSASKAVSLLINTCNQTLPARASDILKT